MAEQVEPWNLRQGDCLDIARGLTGQAFHLIYIDPPFFTGRHHVVRPREGSSAETAFADTRRGGIPQYVQYLGERIAAIRELLAPEGSMLIHLDWRTVHHVKVRCDALFGERNFQNEIIWSYRSGGGTKKRYGRKHDTVLWYSMGRHPVFNTDEARVPYDAVIAPKRSHLFHERGKVSGDVLDIARPPNHAKEWLGWPTQKPLALMEWFVRVHSRPGDLVGDFFCGSGTTLVAAVKQNRQAFGCDQSAEALDLTRSRLRELLPRRS